MKMMIAIVQDKFIDKLMSTFYDAEIYVTKIASSGGFFKNGNTTLLLGAEEENLEKVYKIFREITEAEEVDTARGRVQVSGATIFVVDVEDSLRI
ncbi:cyclic-di-AMP receptor [Peptoniphilus equinus]|uniref:Cyclic-di-AMP receptor n=1 Tax=Peptoniphilus equinus TaxID=3016343 RepID=A0ABY7QSI7_9FIRM|nr:cyclic-di-AMP receptor [Peptoniphilus equinus]WBW49758.1 cyclic-di-AMP receptor [Peptoniphilus equinus]